MKILTAHEQVEMMGPWRLATRIQEIDPFDVSDEADRAAGLFSDESDEPLASLAWRHGGEIAMINTHPDHQRQGHATMLFNHIKQHMEPNLHHSPHQTEEGAAWAKGMPE